jgi:UDP-N-acetylmuramoyl-tripeptide--D-alanyl-D-alanine ligase
MTNHPLWIVADMARAMKTHRHGDLPANVTGISIDSRTLAKGEAYFAIKGETHDGHAFVGDALARGAGLAVVAADKREGLPTKAPLLVVDDVLSGLTDLAGAARARSRAQVIAVTGSVGKTSTKEALRVALSREKATHASVASFNNHWGVPLSLARLPERAAYAIFEIGMNHAGEITPLTKLVRPHVAIITTVEPVHLEFFPSVEAIADAKAEIFLGLEPDGAAVLNRDNPHFARLRERAAEAGVARIVTFGAAKDCDARLVKFALQPDSSTVEADILGERVTYKLGAPGRHQALNSLAVLAAAKLAGADLALAALALADFVPPAGRGSRVQLSLPDGMATLIDETYNANPTSMRAAIALLGQMPVGHLGRRIAVLGDMLELGDQAATLHRQLASAIKQNAVDLVFCAGPLMRSLYDALPANRRGAHAEDAAALEAEVLAGVHGGDAVMVKGSAGSRMGPIVKALAKRYSRPAPQDVE